MGSKALSHPKMPSARVENRNIQTIYRGHHTRGGVYGATMEALEFKKKLLTRIKRAQGQVSAIHRMLDEDADSLDVLIQIAAVQGALNKAGQDLLSNHIKHCVTEVFDPTNSDTRADKMEELLNLFERYTHIGGPS